MNDVSVDSDTAMAWIMCTVDSFLVLYFLGSDMQIVADMQIVTCSCPLSWRCVPHLDNQYDNEIKVEV